MQYLNTFLALTALSAVSVTALPFRATQRDSPAAPCPSTSLKISQSTVFGWQLAGSAALSPQLLSQTCDAVLSPAAQKWADQGLNLENIQSPVCDNSIAEGLNASTALPKAVFASTKVFTTLITNAFAAGDKGVWGYLCKNIRFKQVTGFLLDDVVIVNATCNLAGKKIAPEPFVSIGGATVNRSAVAAYKDAQSKLFAYMYASQATNTDDLDTLCADASTPLKRGAWHALELHGTCVKDTICSVKGVIDVEGGKDKIREWTSRSFIAVIENISNEPGYKKWLCEHLDEGAMEDVGMDGVLVRGTVCRDAGEEAS